MKPPIATYRLQLSPEFTFRDAARIVPYLHRLGISHIYASPILQPRRKSPHGYDVVDPTRLNPELGTEDDFRSLAALLAERGMGWIQDIVPNHMAYDGDNRMLMDVFENGEDSPYHGFFDILWDAPPGEGGDRVLAPFLGRFYGETLEAGEIRLGLAADGFFLTYGEMRFPLRISTYPDVLDTGLEKLQSRLGENHPEVAELLQIIHTLRSLPGKERLADRYRSLGQVKSGLWNLYERSRAVRRHLDGVIELYNGRPGEPRSFDLMDALLGRQIYRLAFWKVASEEVNYRRFFNVSRLISLRVEDPRVFDHVHSLTLALMEEGLIQGLRVDHIDGLYDPTAYLAELRRRAPDAYILVEKILGGKETLLPDWPVEGTTGYDFMNRLTQAFCDPGGERLLDRTYASFTRSRLPFGDLVWQKKHLVIRRHMGGNVDILAHLARRCAARSRHGRDVTLYGLRRALEELLASFPVYRTYIGPAGIHATDREYMEEAFALALRRNPGAFYELRLLQDFFLNPDRPEAGPGERADRLHLVMRFQQYSCPPMAKGFEDTVLYVYARLLSLNEVGGDPDRVGATLADFHAFNSGRIRRRPHSMNATSTHDTKRGEDTRARLNVLSEIPRRWDQAVRNWRRINRRRKPRIEGNPVPDRNDEYFLYQTLLGTWPVETGITDHYRHRIRQYMIKAVREAKVHTAWIKPDTDYEDGFTAFIDRILETSGENAFLAEVADFARRTAHHGMLNSLSQTLVKLTAPGVPDIYQGAEMTDFSLVDPDNRRPVDFELRASLVEGMTGDPRDEARSALEAGHGPAKLFLIQRALGLRRERIDLFGEGAYIPLDAEGPFAVNVVSFARTVEGEYAVTVVPRFTAALVEEGRYPLGEDVWGDTTVNLPQGFPRHWREALTGKDTDADPGIRVGRVLDVFPAALVVSRKGES
jgi:(1->4)-alpha-D-glucan 1-alpha-D-glucosylmutase